MDHKYCLYEIGLPISKIGDFDLLVEVFERECGRRGIPVEYVKCVYRLEWIHTDAVYVGKGGRNRVLERLRHKPVEYDNSDVVGRTLEAQKLRYGRRVTIVGLFSTYSPFGGDDYEMYERCRCIENYIPLLNRQRTYGVFNWSLSLKLVSLFDFANGSIDHLRALRLNVHASPWAFPGDGFNYRNLRNLANSDRNGAGLGEYRIHSQY